MLTSMAKMYVLMARYGWRLVNNTNGDPLETEGRCLSYWDANVLEVREIYGRREQLQPKRRRQNPKPDFSC